MPPTNTRRSKKQGNIEVRYENTAKHRRHYVIVRHFEDGGGDREFTLWLSRDELLDVLDCGDDLTESVLDD